MNGMQVSQPVKKKAILQQNEPKLVREYVTEKRFLTNREYYECYDSDDEDQVIFSKSWLDALYIE